MTVPVGREVAGPPTPGSSPGGFAASRSNPGAALQQNGSRLPAPGAHWWGLSARQRASGIVKARFAAG